MKAKWHGRQYLDPEDDLDGWINWAVLDLKDVEHLGDVDIVCALGMVLRYSGPGQYFSWPGMVRRGKSRVLVTQFCGYDI